MKFNRVVNFSALLLLSFASAKSLAAQSVLEEVLVTAELIEQSVLSLPNSVSVIDQSKIAARSANHLEDLLGLAPNVNYASGASRGRFIQIRGVGERSEFQEPIINSVGVLLDGIDLTGLATAATSLDIAQVEILRGPQGTLHGANAMAGLINLVSNKPSEESQATLSVGLEEYSGKEVSAAFGGSLSQSTQYRAAIKKYQSDGYYQNSFLGTSDTNNLDELSARVRVISQLNQQAQLDAAIFVADIDNGYDAFSLDNNRQTYSDQPGVDSQETIGASAKLTYQFEDGFSLEALLSGADSQLEYRYDEDWSHTGICEGTACDSSLFGFDWFYSSQDQYLRDNKNHALDVSLSSYTAENLSWRAGVYHRDQSIDLNRIYTYSPEDFTSDLSTQNSALYGQVDFQLSDNWSVSSGLRFERRTLDYVDNSVAQASFNEHLWGGKLALEYRPDAGGMWYGLISRGYKPGGFNLEATIQAEQRKFDTESMLNFEVGYKNKLLDNRLSLQATVFYQDRSDIQTKQSIVRSIATAEVGGACPCSFTDFTDNAASGKNKGVEIELEWAASDRARLYASLGLLESEFGEFLSFEHIDADRENGVAFNMKGREQAHAPSYQWVIGGHYQLSTRFELSASVEGKDDFFFSDRHDEKSEAYQLANLQLGYQQQNWQVALYIKNVTNEDIKTRGFGSFGNDPRKFYEREQYSQFAAPRVAGVKASFAF